MMPSVELFFIPRTDFGRIPMRPHQNTANTFDVTRADECADRKLDARRAETIGVRQPVQILRQLRNVRDRAMQARIKITPRQHVFSLENADKHVPWQSEFKLVHLAYEILQIREADTRWFDQTQARDCS